MVVILDAMTKRETYSPILKCDLLSEMSDVMRFKAAQQGSEVTAVRNVVEGG